MAFLSQGYKTETKRCKRQVFAEHVGKRGGVG